MFRDLFFKTTRARHPSRRLRFVYSFLRMRRRVYFFVRPRSRFSAFFRLRILRKMFVWFYTDRFLRFAFFRRFIAYRQFKVRSFLAFCTRLESFVPVLVCRLHFVSDMRTAFSALTAGFIFINGRRVAGVSHVARLGDFVELRLFSAYLSLSFFQFFASLPRFRLTIMAQEPEFLTPFVFYGLVSRYRDAFMFSLPRASASSRGEITTETENESFIKVFCDRFSFLLYHLVPVGGRAMLPAPRTLLSSGGRFRTAPGFWWRSAVYTGVVPPNRATASVSDGFF